MPTFAHVCLIHLKKKVCTYIQEPTFPFTVAPCLSTKPRRRGHSEDVLRCFVSVAVPVRYGGYIWLGLGWTQASCLGDRLSCLATLGSGAEGGGGGEQGEGGVRRWQGQKDSQVSENKSLSLFHSLSFLLSLSIFLSQYTYSILLYLSISGNLLPNRAFGHTERQASKIFEDWEPVRYNLSQLSFLPIQG